MGKLGVGWGRVCGCGGSNYNRTYLYMVDRGRGVGRGRGEGGEVLAGGVSVRRRQSEASTC
jgi:hypothetical protein